VDNCTNHPGGAINIKTVINAASYFPALLYQNG